MLPSSLLPNPFQDQTLVRSSSAPSFNDLSSRNRSRFDSSKDLGDLGLVAKASHSSQSMMRKPDPLTVSKESGKDSQEKKKNHIKALLVAAIDCEPQYLIRLLQAKLRIGLAEQTLLAALGQAAVYTKKHSTPPLNIQSPLEEVLYDGVDILSLSVGPNSPPTTTKTTYLNPFDAILLSAVKAGIFVAQAAGNGGPFQKTLVSYSPWIASVAAAVLG